MLKIAIYLQTPRRGPVTFPITKKAGISHPRLESPQTLRGAILAAPRALTPPCKRIVPTTITQKKNHPQGTLRKEGTPMICI